MAMHINNYIPISILTIFFILLPGCVTSRIEREVVAVRQAQNISEKSEYLKVHLSDGSLYVLFDWNIEADKEIISGHGSYYNPNRKLISESRLEKDFFYIPFSEIALIETNHIKKNSVAAIAAMTVVSAPFIIISIVCLTNPKACFGSCPTFYVNDGDNFRLQAEGFSSSIARALEKRDIDKLYLAANTGKDFTIQVKNEALETHAIRYADLLIFQSDGHSDVFATPEGKFYRAEKIYKPVQCTGPEGDFSEAVFALDKKERFSLADSSNLSSREELNISFSGLEQGRYGLLIGSRQTLLTTFLFYQSLANMGNYVPFYGLKLENGNRFIRKNALKMYDLLGGIEVFTQNYKKKFEKIGELKEMGPIAADINMIEIPVNVDGDLNIRLRLTKGLWRLDYLALVKIREVLEPLRVQPDRVMIDDSIDTLALQNLIDRDKFLVTYPHESYSIIYSLPEQDQDYIFFLESSGYYYEWKRDSWVADQNLRLFRMMFMFPGHYLKVMAPVFKQNEPYMEEIFWNSRYAQ